MAVEKIREKGLFINDRELVALQELIWAGYPYAYVLYVQGLRRFMDQSTGIVGDRRIVCERGMRETLEREKRQGVSGKVRSRDYIQRQIKALELVGLIERLPKKHRLSPMRFWLPLAVTGSIRPVEVRTKVRTKVRTATARSAAAENAGENVVILKTCAENPLPGYMNHAQESAQNPAQRSAQHQEKLLQQQQGGSFSLDQLAAVDLAMVVALYHEILPGLPTMGHWDTTGYRLLVARIWYRPSPGKPDDFHQTEKFWRAYFTACARSDFLMGRIVPNPRKGPFRATFRTLVQEETVIKMKNGEYS